MITIFELLLKTTLPIAFVTAIKIIIMHRHQTDKLTPPKELFILASGLFQIIAGLKE
ncbi:MAG: hypothetical protein HQM08_25770 [Candidatus Riflebacteria bacterium]|nr:hypothetical protein [Candidatus Riflebacteria bacterium]